MASIYISSTFADLREEREAARDAIRRLDHRPVHSYTATERRPLDACLSDVRQCQAYVGILGWRYGSVTRSRGKSFTELEYEEAGKQGIPRLVFLRGEGARVPIDWTDSNRAEIRRFRQRALESHVTVEFSDHNQLIVAVEDAIRKEIGAGEPVPEELPWSADRTRQEEEFEDALMRWTSAPLRPLVCVVDGDEYQGLGPFADRLKALAGDLLAGGNEAVTPYDLRWPRSARNPRDFQAKLLRKLSWKVLEQRDAEATEVVRFLSRNPGPVAIRSQLLTEDWQRHGSRVFDGYLAFWRTLPDLLVERKVIAFLTVKYQLKKTQGFFKRRQLRRLNARIRRHLDALDPASRGRGPERSSPADLAVLSCLEGVTQSEVEDWAGADAILDFCGRSLETDVRDLFEHWQKRWSAERIPMEELAELLTRLLHRYNYFRESRHEVPLLFR